jgi:PilZ domain
MEITERRRSDRVSLFSAIRVRGSDAAGEAFSVEARTVLVTLHGAAIIINRELTANQQINVRCYGMDTEAEARVVGRIEKHPEGFLYGVQFLDPTINPWNIKFPASGPAPNAVGRLLLSCGDCQRRELVYLDELELEVFGANQGLTRFCTDCQKPTTWKATPQEVPAAEADAAASAQDTGDSPAALVPRTRNDRQFLRVRMKLKACIRHPELGEEVVDCDDVSRGGISFTSPKVYARDTLIETAVPYLAGQANIFTRARIANLRPAPQGKGLTKYGVAYLS